VISATALPTPIAADVTTDFVEDMERIADALDRRLRRELTPEQYAMVRDLQLATRVVTIARDTLDERATAA
jgi:ABC-type transporter lipoprotein component MlaA